MSRRTRCGAGRGLALGAGLALVTGACGGETDRSSTDVAAGEVRAEAREAYEAAREFTAEEVQAFRTAMGARLDQLEQRMQDARERAAELSEDARQSAQARLAALEERREELHEQLAGLKADSREAWEQARQRIRAAVEELESGFKDARESLTGDAA